MKESGIFASLFQNIIIRKYLVFTWNVSFFKNDEVSGA